VRGKVVNGLASASEVPVDFLKQIMPLAKTLGIETLVNTPSEVRARLTWAESLCTSGGVLHGGVIMALADSTGGACAFLNLPDGASGTTTIQSTTNFLRAVRGGHVEAASRPLHAGRTVIVVETDVTDADGKRVARVTQSQAVLRPS
jgi:1,4-dihydroxy-2-naphthoyl-CoA hydrolase